MEDKQIELEAELGEIFAEMETGNPRHRQGVPLLKELILVAVRYPESWEKGSLEAFGRRYGVTRERIRQILWRTAAEIWHIKYRKSLCERFGHPIELKFTVISKPNTKDFVTLFADNLREKYHIQPEEGEYEWSQLPEEEKPMCSGGKVCEGLTFDDEDFITADREDDKRA